MTDRSPTVATRAALDRPWAPAVRLVAGAAAGWAAVRWGVAEPVPAWGQAGAAGVAAGGALAAPAVARSVLPWVVTGWAAASALGLYLAVPETDHVVGVGAVLIVLVLVSVPARLPVTGLLVAGLDVVLLWAAVRGAPGGGPELVAGLALPGLLIIGPAVSLMPGPRRPLVPDVARPAGLVGLQAVFAVLVARRGATVESVAASAAIAVAALVALVIAARLTVGARSW